MTDDRIIAWYDEAIHDGGIDGKKSAQAIQEVADRIVAEPDSIDMPPQSELIRQWVTSSIRAERNARARSKLALFQRISDALLDIRDALADQVILSKEDPIFRIALRTGRADGLDKSLEFWAIEDWLEVLGASAENVASAVEADKQLRAIVNPIVAAYARRRANHLGEMFT